ncbi:MAG: rhodanese-like domain-containing protein [Eudoraea sp.]|nr:rhodanese-like domain-containing protein [Eudoraea sp.]
MSLFNTIFGSRSATSENVEVLEVEAFKKAVHMNKVQLVDVRTHREFKGGHIARARNIDYYTGESFYNEFEKMDKTKPLYLYCRTGNRSNKAAHQLAARGFEKVYDLKGGIVRWK